MCGIFGYIGKKTNAAQIVLDGLKSLEYRGYDSWGVAVIPVLPVIPAQAGIQKKITLQSKGILKSQRDHFGTVQDDKIIIKKNIGKIGTAHVNDLPTSHLAFGHTRWATHGGVTERNAHPHLDCSQTIAVVHNGIIENYQEIKNKLIANGHRFVSETDTEVAVHLIEEYVKTKSLTDAVRQAFNDCTGLNALIVTSRNDPKIIAVRNGSPLAVGFGTGENLVASDATALLPHTRTVHFLEDDELAVLTEKTITISNVKTGNEIPVKKVRLSWAIDQTQLGNFPHFMLKEIHEQPRVLESIASQSVSIIEKNADTIKDAANSYLLGCGSASYVAIAGAYLFSKIAGKHINWAIGSEFGYQLNFLNSRSVIIPVSQSGETMDILESVKKAKQKYAKIVALVNVFGSTLYREADHKILIAAGPEKAVASTKAVTAMLAHLILLAYALAGKTKTGQDVVKQAIASTNQLLSPKSIGHLKRLAHQFKTIQHLFVIGRGLSYPASLETALKIKEIAYIHAEGMAAGELKHGPLALVEKDTPCIAFLPNDETYGANLAGAMEMKARGAKILGISHTPHEIFDEYIEVRDAEEATIIPNIVAAQLLAYYVTIERNLDPDKPRNLAKSVTVK